MSRTCGAKSARISAGSRKRPAPWTCCSGCHRRRVKSSGRSAAYRFDEEESETNALRLLCMSAHARCRTASRRSDLCHRELDRRALHGTFGRGNLDRQAVPSLSPSRDLIAAEAEEIGPLLKRVSQAVQALTQADRLYVCLWSHSGWQPAHIHFVVQPAWNSWCDAYARTPVPGHSCRRPCLELAMRRQPPKLREYASTPKSCSRMRALNRRAAAGNVGMRQAKCSPPCASGAFTFSGVASRHESPRFAHYRGVTLSKFTCRRTQAIEAGRG
jgi:hypothetical protein